MKFPVKKMLSWAGNPLILALPLTVAVILLLPDTYRKYRSEPVRTGVIDKPGGYEYYADLDRDTYSERVILFNNTEGKASVKILDHNGFISGHHYFRGAIIRNPASLQISEYDTSRIPGIFLFTLSNDTVLLHGICPGGEKRELFLNYPVTAIREENGHHDFTISSFDLLDLDRDGTREIVAGIMAGFRVQPRLLFSYDIRSGTISRTPVMAAYQGISDTIDLTGDGLPELLARSYAINNNQGRQGLSFDDHSAWLLAYDRTLEPVFAPVEFPGEYVMIIPFGIRDHDRPGIVALLTTRVPGTGSPRLMYFDANGTCVRERVLGDDKLLRNYSFFRSEAHPGRIVLVSDGGEAEEIDSRLNTLARRTIEGVDLPGCNLLDLDGDGIREIVFSGSPGGEVVITRADLSDPVRVAHPYDLGSRHLQSIRDAEGNGALFIQSGDHFTVHKYERNPVAWLKYPLWIAIFLLMTGFISLVRWVQRVSLSKQFEAEKKIAELQLLLLGNQLDPHFTFNAINSISASLLHQDTGKANRDLVSLSRLMRAGVMQSDKIDRSLAEELDFLQNYISLIHQRLEGCFTYGIDLEEGIDLAIRVPKMIVQIFVENAIKHGLKPMLAPGRLQIIVRKEGRGVTIAVEDNGVGRNHLGTNDEQGAGKGMAIVQQTITILNRFNSRKIRLEIADGCDEQGRPCGTRVRLTIPEGIRYRFYKD